MSKLSEKGQFRPIQSVLTAPNYRPGIIKTNWYVILLYLKNYDFP